MRVLFVTNRYPTPQIPGDSPAIAQQRQALIELGHEVDVFLIPSRRGKLTYLAALFRMIRVAHLGRRYDVVHAHYGSFCAWVARMQLRSPVVVTFRGSDVMNERELPISRAVSRFIKGAIVMSEEMKHRLGRRDAEIIPYGIDGRLFQPRSSLQARRDLGLSETAPLVVFPYDPSRPEKRFDLVDEAMELVRQQVPEAELVVMHGEDHARVADHMNACSALVLASDTEGAPVAVREALACRLPVVSVDVGDVANLIGDVDGCELVDRAPTAIARALLSVIRADKRLGVGGAVTSASYSVADAAEDVSDLYRRATSKSRHKLRATSQ